MGIIVAVRRGIQTQRIMTHTSLQGRVVVLDLIIPSSDGRGFPHRLVALYAPFDPGQEDADLFWDLITQICRESPYSFSAAGDFNVTLASSESSARNDRDNFHRARYLRFLHDTDSTDLWAEFHDRSAIHDYTCKSGSGCSIIDRAIHSNTGVLTGSIEISPGFIGATDHRAIISSIILLPPNADDTYSALPNQPYSSFYKPRPHYPKRKEKHRFTDFASRVDEVIAADRLHDIAIDSNESFQQLYEGLTKAFDTAAVECFEFPKIHSSRTPRKVSNTTIRLLVRESRRIGRLICAAKHNRLYRLLHFFLTFADL